MTRNCHVRFGKGPTEKDPDLGHLAGGPLHSTLATPSITLAAPDWSSWLTESA